MRTDDLGAVVRLYNDAVAAIPCNWPLTKAEFADALLGNGTLSSPGRRLDPDTVYVAGAAGTPLGFVDFTLTGGNELIRFLAFPPQRPEVGAALLTAALRHLCRAGCTHVEAWRMKHGYPFYAAWHGGCWEQSHVTNLLLAHGFENLRQRSGDRPVHPARVPLPRHQHHPAQAAGSERRPEHDKHAGKCSFRIN